MDAFSPFALWGYAAAATVAAWQGWMTLAAMTMVKPNG